MNDKGELKKKCAHFAGSLLRNENKLNMGWSYYNPGKVLFQWKNLKKEVKN